jgi:hypothetical protein
MDLEVQHTGRQKNHADVMHSHAQSVWCSQAAHLTGRKAEEMEAFSVVELVVSRCLLRYVCVLENKR